MVVLTHILNTLNSVSAETWSVVVDTIVAAVIVSPFMVGVKKWLKVTSEKYMVTLVILGSMFAAACTYLLTVPELSPWVILVRGWLVFATTQPVFFLFIKPLFKRLSAWFSSQVAKAAVIIEAKNAAVPAEGLPSADANSSDFSH